MLGCCPKDPGDPRSSCDEGDIGPASDQVGRSGERKGPQGRPKGFCFLGLEPKVTTEKGECGMGQGHPHQPIGKAGEIEEPKGRIETRRLPIGQVGNATGDIRIPKGEKTFVKAFKVIGMVRISVKAGIDMVGKAAFPEEGPDHQGG